ncbi:MAG: AAA family ATPase [Candidatus Paceibacterota bacterium]
MKLKYIELKGFKSFAKKERLHFEKHITAIVGPNGSGKSNIAEGFRFVLGEQSMKSLRSKKTEDLLFNGSSSMSRVNRASVVLVFDNTQREIREAFDEIQIERIIHRDATNEYYINGTRARLKDITQMLAEAKIGSAGHHIISQGEADKMLSMTSRERKEYLEEALGLTQYQNKKNEALKKLIKTQENLVSIRSLIRELAPHVRYLEREMKLIQKKKELSGELEVLTREYIRLYLPFSTKELVQKEHEHKKTTETIQTIKERQGEAIEEVAIDEEYRTLRASLETDIEAVSREWNRLRKEKSEFERQVGRLETKIELLSENLTPPRETKKHIPDAPLRLIQIREILQKIRTEEDITLVQEMVAEALVLTEVGGSREENEVRTEHDSELQNIHAELKKLYEQITQNIDEEDRLLLRKKELEKAYADTFQKEQQEKSDAEKDELELHSLEIIQKGLEREIDTLRQNEAYLYSSLEEVVVLTGARFTDDIKNARELSSEEVTRDVLREREHAVERLKLRIEGMQVGNTREIEAEYTSAKEREKFLETEMRDLELTAEKLVGIAESLHLKIEAEFKEGITQISTFFSTFFSQMFTGGSAGLRIVALKKRDGETEPDDEEGDEVERGVEVTLSMPHKKLRSVAMLSGGEKTLVSTALIFALSQVNPPPFLILDETDAALDEANSRRYGDALKELSKYSQLILITHNRETMSRAGMLYGVTMGSASTSELLSIDLEEAEKIVK